MLGHVLVMVSCHFKLSLPSFDALPWYNLTSEIVEMWQICARYRAKTVMNWVNPEKSQLKDVLGQVLVTFLIEKINIRVSLDLCAETRFGDSKVISACVTLLGSKLVHFAYREILVLVGRYKSSGSVPYWWQGSRNAFGVMSRSYYPLFSQKTSKSSRIPAELGTPY